MTSIEPLSDLRFGAWRPRLVPWSGLGVIVDGLVDIEKLQPIGRLGYRDYVHVRDSFAMTRPGWPID